MISTLTSFLNQFIDQIITLFFLEFVKEQTNSKEIDKLHSTEKAKPNA